MVGSRGNAMAGVQGPLDPRLRCTPTSVELHKIFKIRHTKNVHPQFELKLKKKNHNYDDHRPMSSPKRYYRKLELGWERDWVRG